MTCDVTRKFQQGVRRAEDLFEGDFFERKRIVEDVERWCKRAKEKKAPILYDYEIVTQSAKRLKDRGHLVFTDGTLTRFHMVMCFGHSHSDSRRFSFEDDYAAITKANAHRLMSLLKYLHHSERKPVFVRATYTTQGRSLHPDFLSSSETPVNAGIPIFHVTPDNFIPSLLPSDVDKIDALIAQNQMPGVLVPTPPEVKQEVIGTKAIRPIMRHFMLADVKVVIQCAHCGRNGQENMRTCSNCRLVRYCRKECQKAAWKVHKAVCMVPQERPVLAVSSSSSVSVNSKQVSQDNERQRRSRNLLACLSLIIFAYVVSVYL
ncbi:hypothetical protein QCA50_006971 [Cerrena zonata]|uniref:MYND-type domain-containing protein n=1 Tax=Cerrena zonata TaxID=2478898 RepID=A0AAW0GF51_9APHY